MNKNTLWFLVAQWGPQGYLFKIANKSDKTLQIFFLNHHIIKIKRAIYDEGKKGLKYERIMVSLISAIWLPRTILKYPKHKKWAPMLHLHKSLHNTVDLADHLLSNNGQCIVLQRKVLCKRSQTVHCTEYINLWNMKCVYFAFVVWKSTSSPVISGSVIDTYTGQQWESSEVRRQADLYKGNHQEEWGLRAKNIQLCRWFSVVNWTLK